jgi:hypothetical protein
METIDSKIDSRAQGKKYSQTAKKSNIKYKLAK